jgi:hypothetical protein
LDIVNRLLKNIQFFENIRGRHMFFEALDKVLQSFAGLLENVSTYELFLNIVTFIIVISPAVTFILLVRFIHRRQQRKRLLAFYDRMAGTKPVDTRKKRVIKLQKVFKVAYFIGDTVAWNSKFKTGYIFFDRGNSRFFSKNDNAPVPFEIIYQVWKIKIPHIGKLLRVNNGKDYIHLCSAHFCVLGSFFFKRTGKTRRLYRILDALATVSKTPPISTQYLQEPIFK